MKRSKDTARNWQRFHAERTAKQPATPTPERKGAEVPCLDPPEDEQTPNPAAQESET